MSGENVTLETIARQIEAMQSDFRSQIAQLKIQLGASRGTDPRLTKEEICARWSCAPRTFERIVARGLLPAGKGPGRPLRWTVDAVVRAERLRDEEKTRRSGRRQA